MFNMIPQAKVATAFSPAASLERAASRLLRFQYQPIHSMDIVYRIGETR